MREVVVVSGVRTADRDVWRKPEGRAADAARRARRGRGDEARRPSTGEEIGHVVFGHVLNTEPKDMYLGARRGSERRSGQGNAVPHAEPSLRQRPAGDRVGRADDHAGRCRRRDRRRRGVHESRGPYIIPSGRWGAAHGRHQGDRHDGRCAARPVRRHPHGRDRRERRGEVGHHARRAGPAGGRKPSPRGQRATEGRRTSRARSCRSKSRARRARRCSTPTSTSAQGTSMADMAKLKPVFVKENGTVTAGNASASTTARRPSC